MGPRTILITAPRGRSAHGRSRGLSRNLAGLASSPWTCRTPTTPFASLPPPRAGDIADTDLLETLAANLPISMWGGGRRSTTCRPALAKSERQPLLAHTRQASMLPLTCLDMVISPARQQPRRSRSSIPARSRSTVCPIAKPSFARQGPRGYSASRSPCTASTSSPCEQLDRDYDKHFGISTPTPQPVADVRGCHFRG